MTLRMSGAKIDTVEFTYDTMAEMLSAAGLPLQHVAGVARAVLSYAFPSEDLAPDELNIACQLFVKIGILFDRVEVAKRKN